MGGTCAAASRQLAGKHWEKFSGQNYFDEKGFFAATMWSGPLLIILIVVIVNMLIQMFYLMVKVKRAEFKKKGKLRGMSKKENAEGTTGAGGDAAPPKGESKKDS